MADKRDIVAQLIEELTEELRAMARVAEEARAGATHEENRPENDKDTRATEASYLARGQAARVRDLERDVLLLRGMRAEPMDTHADVSVGALVEVDSEGFGSKCYFLAVAGGGKRITRDGVDVLVITPQSPMGRALLGHAVGDEVTLVLGGKSRTCEIRSVG